MSEYGNAAQSRFGDITNTVPGLVRGRGCLRRTTPLTHQQVYARFYHADELEMLDSLNPNHPIKVNDSVAESPKPKISDCESIHTIFNQPMLCYQYQSDVFLKKFQCCPLLPY